MMEHKIIQCCSQSIIIFKKTTNSDHILAWNSKRLSNKSIRLSATSDNSLVPQLNCINVRQRVKFDGQGLKEDKITFIYKKVE